MGIYQGEFGPTKDLPDDMRAYITAMTYGKYRIQVHHKDDRWGIKIGY